MTRPLARSTDPITSHEAAEHIRPRVSIIQLEVLDLVREFPGETSTELAHRAGYGDVRKINRRVSELLADERIVVCGERKCRITGRLARIYSLPRPKQSMLF